NPVPKEHELPKSYIDGIIEEAVKEAETQGISGKDSTPFLLGKIVEKSEGKSLNTNIKLVENNAVLGAKIAVAFNTLLVILMSIIFAITGIFFALFIAFLFSYNRKAIDFKKPVIMLIVQIIIVVFMMNTTIGLTILTTLGSFFEELINISKAGIEFVFGGLQNKGASTFFITVLLPLVFISVLIGVLNYFKILPFIIKYVGIIINKITRMGR